MIEYNLYDLYNLKYVVWCFRFCSITSRIFTTCDRLIRDFRPSHGIDLRPRDLRPRVQPFRKLPPLRPPPSSLPPLHPPPTRLPPSWPVPLCHICGKKPSIKPLIPSADLSFGFVRVFSALYRKKTGPITLTVFLISPLGIYTQITDTHSVTLIDH